MTSWIGDRPPAQRALSGGDWLRIAWRAPLVALAIFGLFLPQMLLRLIERPLYGMDRPWTPRITRAACRLTLRVMGLPVTVRGTRMTGPGALVANHTTWLDIFVLNSRRTVYFVAKAEVASWPGIGLLARGTGTVFIRRHRREARAQTALFQERLLHGHRLLFFPEGTSTDGLRVLPFKSTLFEAFFADRLRTALQIQAVSLVYHPPQGAEPEFYGWWGDMDFAPSLLQVLAQRRQGRAVLVYHPPVRVRDFANRKALSAHLEAQVRQGHAAESSALGPDEDSAATP